MPYIVTTTGAGPWAKDQVISDEDFNAHAFHEKFLRTGSVVPHNEDDVAAVDAATNAQAAGELQAQIAALQAQLAQLQGTPTGEPHAPAEVVYDVDRKDQPNATESDANRAAGEEVVQPSPGEVVTGKVTKTGKGAAPPSEG